MQLVYPTIPVSCSVSFAETISLTSFSRAVQHLVRRSITFSALIADHLLFHSHALRRQIHRDYRKPLIVFFSKNLLRHPQARSSIEEFAPDTHFQRYIPEPEPEGFGTPEEVKRHIARRLLLAELRFFADSLLLPTALLWTGLLHSARREGEAWTAERRGHLAY